MSSGTLQHRLMMTHRESCQLDGQFLIETPSIWALNDLDDAFVDAQPWRDVEDLLGYCIGRSDVMPGGAMCDRGLGAQQYTVRGGA